MDDLARDLGWPMTYYVVTWARASDPDEVFTCIGLSPRGAFARLMRALNHDDIIVKRIERQVA